jgi:hypothetical protein
VILAASSLKDHFTEMEKTILENHSEQEDKPTLSKI